MFFVISVISAWRDYNAELQTLRTGCMVGVVRAFSELHSLPETNSSHLKNKNPGNQGIPMKKASCLGAMFVSFREGIYLQVLVFFLALKPPTRALRFGEMIKSCPPLFYRNLTWSPLEKRYGCQPKNRGILPPKWMVKIRENPIKMG